MPSPLVDRVAGIRSRMCWTRFRMAIRKISARWSPRIAVCPKTSRTTWPCMWLHALRTRAVAGGGSSSRPIGANPSRWAGAEAERPPVSAAASRAAEKPANNCRPKTALVRRAARLGVPSAGAA
ncbi:hypothetical protein B0675_28180 [Streptomyces sp. M41(2017)]|nr:hypothetical protein B0675_28180 [Streptomyces sp. M41(2017)]